ncbi:MAG: transposase [Vulcanimicrobiaceae bacterium]
MTTDTGAGEQQRVPGARRSLDLRPGAVVLHAQRQYTLDSVIDFDQAVCLDVEHGTRAVLPLAELSPPPLPPSGANASNDIAAIDKETWNKAQRRYAAIEPLLDGGARDVVEARARELGISTATLYRWLAEYRGQRTAIALIPRTCGWPTGRGRLDPGVERVIEETIRQHYLTPQRLRIAQVARQVAMECRKRGLPKPHYNAVARRIHAIPENERLRARGSRELAERKYRPVPGHFPGADYPLAVVQIDHTPLDVIVVDEEHREPIGRPWLTLSGDICSRMVTGYYLSLDPPCEASVGLCVARSIAPKEALLAQLGIDGEWPVWGVMQTIHVDNGTDFRSGTFRRSCELYGISLEFRPVKAPRFGGHIERLLGTLLRELHTLPGTTFSSIKERGEYRSDRHAALTLDELEKWLVTLICNVYHKRDHSALGTSPRRQWEIGIFGRDGVPGQGLPPRPTDPRRVMLDFMPAFERQIRPTGVSIDGLTYYQETLRSWVGAPDPDDRSKKRTFIFRRDPRDISRIWFYDPASNDYYEIPFANRQLPRMSLWEYRQARDIARKRGMSETDEHKVALAVEDLRRDADEAVHRTKSTRRAKQRRRQHERKSADPATAIVKPSTSVASSPSLSASADAAEALLDDVAPFEEVL